jgi:hypothetical protein
MTSYGTALALANLFSCGNINKEEEKAIKNSACLALLVYC